MRFLKSVMLLVLAIPLVEMGRAQQIHSVVSGRTTMELNTAFEQQIESFGASFTDIGLAALQNGSVSFPIATGSVDLNSAAGELRHRGGLVITADGNDIRLLDWVLDVTGPQPTITVLFVINGSERGRFPMFFVQPPPNLGLPLQPQAGTIVIKQASLFLSQAGASTFNYVFGLDGSEQLQANMAVGNIDVYAVLSGSTVGTQ